MINRIIKTVKTEDDTLYYKITGDGIPIIMIPGAGGDGDIYLPLADKLSQHYKVITYDRRANRRSTMNFPKQFDISQQARDAVAVLHACNEDKAYFFGNSSGAVIALEVATLFPEVVLSTIIHEPPLARLAPDSKKWLNFFETCKERAYKFGGSSMAAMKFLLGIEVPVIKMIHSQLKVSKYVKNELKQTSVNSIPSSIGTDYLIKQELVPITEYMVNIEKLCEIKDKIIIAAGTHAQERKTWLFETAKHLSEEISCELVIFPGHHASFMDDADNWSVILMKHLSS